MGSNNDRTTDTGRKEAQPQIDLVRGGDAKAGDVTVAIGMCVIRLATAEMVYRSRRTVATSLKV